MSVKMLRVAAALVATLALSSCGSAAPPPTYTPMPVQTTPAHTPASKPTAMAPLPVNPEVNRASMDFGFRLFNQLADRDGTKNLFISPTSVSMALAMTYNGAEGETKTAMARTLGLEGMSLARVNDAYAALLSNLNRTDAKVEIAVANSLWTRLQTTFREEFLNRCRQFYQAEVTALELADPAAIAAINQWVSKNTRGKIPIILERVDPSAQMYLVNAVYFNGLWATEFDPAATKEMPFHLPGGGEKPHPMMAQSGFYMYLENGDFQAVRLPYGEGLVSMYVYLPKPESSLPKLLGQLTASNWETWLPKFNVRKGAVVLPRFKSEYQADLVMLLTALGMGIAFDGDKADFTGMQQNSKLYINRVVHKALVQVDEKGTEAAAVTVVGAAPASAMPPPPFNFVADRPFFYAIVDHQTGMPLFMGTVVAPQT